TEQLPSMWKAYRRSRRLRKFGIGNISSHGSSNVSMRRRTFLHPATAAPVLAQNARPQAGAQWTQWGGPHRNFQTEAAGLKDQWPAAGPKVVWKRPLGEGYSS